MNKIIVETTINASLEKVWQYWTQPEHITNGILQAITGIALRQKTIWWLVENFIIQWQTFV